METSKVSSERVIAELVEMGFEFPLIMEAIEAVGPSLDDAIEFILNSSQRKDNARKCSTSNSSTSGKRASSCSLGESSIRPKSRIKTEISAFPNDGGSKMNPTMTPVSRPRVQEIGPDWEQKVNDILKKHFGFSSLKSFQKKALEAWLANEDCLVLAATGSGKSLCFQIPALLTGKVVVVISPLISLMHDQCLKLSKHGVSACFLGSGQSDSSVEKKAMNGVFDLVYVCPETVVRLVEPLQRLAENRGIALFAIDEAHCIAKWGHDFRPDYRRLSILRENFRAGSLKFVESDIPMMALTATATIHVREEILESLCMSKETKIILTSFFRPNLRFSVKHSATSSESSYEKDFHELIDVYTKRVIDKGEPGPILHESEDEFDSSSTSDTDEDSDKQEDMSVEHLEDELDVFQSVDDFDVTCGEFYGCSSTENEGTCGQSEMVDLLSEPEERIKLLEGPLEHGSTIIYVPYRRETVELATYLSQSGVKAAPYHAKLPKQHLRQVHKGFHENSLEVIVATIAFGMGIDKSNVRRIIHYGWPQSLEAYYQEAGRAGRDGKLADCILYANLSRIPTLLPSRRSEEQTKLAYRMLTDCFRYAVGTATCRAKTLVEYFGEDFRCDKCLLCDVCVSGPPKLQNLKEEADNFMRVLASNYARTSYKVDGRLLQKPNLRMVITSVKKKIPRYALSDQIWWQGLARILEDKGYIREGAELRWVRIRFPEPTDMGLRFLQSKSENAFDVYPEADMMLSTGNFSSFSTSCRQRLIKEKLRRKLRKKRSTGHAHRQRLVSKLFKPKR